LLTNNALRLVEEILEEVEGRQGQEDIASEIAIKLYRLVLSVTTHLKTIESQDVTSIEAYQELEIFAFKVIYRSADSAQCTGIGCQIAIRPQASCQSTALSSSRNQTQLP
jgi:hypothetical protein